MPPAGYQVPRSLEFRSARPRNETRKIVRCQIRTT